MPSRASVPIIPTHPPDDMMLHVARLEAQRVSDEARRDQTEFDVAPRDLWRPV